MSLADRNPPPSSSSPTRGRNDGELAFVLQGELARRLRALATRLGTTPLDEIDTAVALHLDALETVEVPS
jgi:hypothetical protein